MTEKMVRIGKVVITEQERLAFEIINLRTKAEEGKKTEDYIQDAARCIAKSILNIIIDDVDEYTVACEVKDEIVQVNARLIRHEENIGDNVYKCWYDVLWDYANTDLPGTAMDMKCQFGYVLEYAATYFSEELVEEVVKSMSDILGEPELEKTKSEKSHLWKFEVE